MDMCIIICGQLLSLLEILIVIYYLFQCLEWKEQIRNHMAWTSVLCGVMGILAQFNGAFQHSHVIVIGMYILVLLVFSQILLKGTFQLKLFTCLLPFLVIAIIDILIMQIFATSKSKAVNIFLGNKDIHLIVGAALAKLIVFCILKMIVHVFKKNNLKFSGKFYLIVNMLIVLNVSMEILLFYVVNSGVYNLTLNKMLIAISMGMVLTSFYIGYSIYKIGEQNGKILKYELMQLQNQEKEQQIEEFKRSYNRIRQFTHDYKNHCLSMQKLLENEQYKELQIYLQKLTGRYLQQHCEFINTKNAVIDSILNTKIHQCKENSVEIICEVIGDISDIEGLETGIILFNLLDNAIEACMKLQKGKIELKMKRKKGAFDIIVQNTIEQSVLNKNQSLHTDKEDEEIHGIGHIAVEELAEELCGMVEYYEEDSMFCVHVFLPI